MGGFAPWTEIPFGLVRCERYGTRNSVTADHRTIRHPTPNMVPAARHRRNVAWVRLLESEGPDGWVHRAAGCPAVTSAAASVTQLAGQAAAM